jgi:hypothetical protein
MKMMNVRNLVAFNDKKGVQTMNGLRIIQSLIIYILLCSAVIAQNEEFKLTASDPIVQSNFGYSVAISGTKVLAGRIRDNNETGAVYHFEYDGSDWLQIEKIVAVDGTDHDKFGCSVSMSDNLAIIGAENDDPHDAGSGSAYLMEYYDNSWHHLKKLIPTDGYYYSYFGHSVSISGSTVILGAWQDDINGDRSGAAYIYQQTDDTWQKISASDGSSNKNFGNAVAVSDAGTAIVGCWYDNPMGDKSGSAYIFEYIGQVWQETAKLTPSDGAAFDEFGYSVAISGTTAIVGAHLNDAVGAYSGAAYVFEYSNGNWTEVQKLIPSNVLHGSYHFGNAVSISGNIIVIGAEGGQGNADATGCAYVYENDGTSWVEIDRIFGSDGLQFDAFGNSVSISNTYVIASAPSVDDTIGINTGAAYVYHLDGLTFVTGFTTLQTFQLDQNYPNPFNPSTTIKFQIPELSFVSIKVYDVLGKEITTLLNEEKSAGSYEIEFDGTGLPSGIYFYQLKIGSFIQTKKMALLK